MSAAVSFPKLAALADVFSYRDELGRQCREALSTIDRLEAEVAKLRQDVGTLEVRGWQERCTPAERALIDAAVEWRREWNTTGNVVPAREALDAAADAVLAERGEAGQCPNCDHDNHYGERCDGDADGDECVCSWPDPGNFPEARP